MNRSNESTSSGLGIFDVLTLIFIVLKCTGLINWSWWLVFSPIFASIGLGIVVVLIKAIVKERRIKKNSINKENK